jgi:hypothetical protein
VVDSMCKMILSHFDSRVVQHCVDVEYINKLERAKGILISLYYIYHYLYISYKTQDYQRLDGHELMYSFRNDRKS